MKKQMEASDALHGFVAWLLSQDGPGCNRPDLALGKFLKANDIKDPSPEYPNSFVMPKNKK